jgi:hypothetical protein
MPFPLFMKEMGLKYILFAYFHNKHLIWNILQKIRGFFIGTISFDDTKMIHCLKYSSLIQE